MNTIFTRVSIRKYEDRIEKCREILGLEGERSAFSILTLGYPAQERTQKDRFHPEKISYR